MDNGIEMENKQRDEIDVERQGVVVQEKRPSPYFRPIAATIALILVAAAFITAFLIVHTKVHETIDTASEVVYMNNESYRKT